MAGIQAPQGTEITSSITEKDKKSHDSKSYGPCKLVTEKKLETGLIGEHSAAEKPDDPLPLKGSEEIVKELKSEEDRALHVATKAGDVDVVRCLTEHSAQMDARNEENDQALHFAAEEGRVDVVKCLIEQGAQVDAKNESDEHPLHFAAVAGHVDVVKCLIEHGAQVDAESWSHNQALHYAAMAGHVDVVKYLIEHNAQVDAMNEIG